MGKKGSLAAATGASAAVAGVSMNGNMLVLWSRRVIRRLDPTERSSLDKAVVKS